MKIAESNVFVTGANRGIGARFVAELVDRGANRIYAGVREHTRAEALVDRFGDTVVPIVLDVTDEASANDAAARAADVNFLINNAGVLNFGDPLDTPLESLRAELEVNYLGVVTVTRAFAPVIEAAGGGAILNVLTIIALAPMPGMGGYCASKAAAYSATQSVRHALAGRGIKVHGAFPGGVDTDMLAAYDGPKADPAEVARRCLDGVEADVADITPDDFSTSAYASWTAAPTSLEAMFTRGG
jgi:NAD(P)-dependent dehydrogenase (short-subunit alcohol dehydrogenase family)